MRISVILVSMLLCVSSAMADVKVRVQAGDMDLAQVIVRVPLKADQLNDGDTSYQVRDSADKFVAYAQVVPERLLAASDQRELVFVLEKLPKSETLDLTLVPLGGAKTPPSFHWIDDKGKHTDLQFGDRNVLRYMYETLDESSLD